MRRMQGTGRAVGALWVRERGWDAGQRMGMVGTGCVGHTGQEARGPDVARAARGTRGPEHPLRAGRQIPAETRRSFPKKTGGVGRAPNLLQSRV